MHNFFQEGNKKENKTSSLETTNYLKSKANKNAWANTHLVMANVTNMQNKILLDRGSSTTVFYNEDYCDTIKPTQKVQMKTNGGDMYMNKSCTIPNLGSGYFNKNRLTNIIVLTDMRKKFRVMYNSSKESAFLVHTPSKIIKFSETKEGVYAIDMDEKIKKTDEEKLKRDLIKKIEKETKKTEIRKQ